MNKILEKIIVSIVLITLMITALKTYVNAINSSIVDTKETASLTITSWEDSNKATRRNLAGVEFTLYYITKDIETVEDAETYIKNNEVETYSKTTPDSGTVEFKELKLGRYLVKETNEPKNVVEKTESFLIDLPKASDDGVGFNYNIVIYPKTKSIYGEMTLNKKTEDNKPLEGTEWKLEKFDVDRWVDYEYKSNLITDTKGTLTIQDLEVGNYRIYETKAKEGYILDSSNMLEFTIDKDNTEKIIDVKNEKPNIEKNIYSNGEQAKNIGVFKKDKVNWSIKVDVPSMITKMKTYYITDTLSEGLKVEDESIKIEATYRSGEKEYLQEESFTKSIQEEIMTISFNPKNLENIEKLEITYDTSFLDNVENGEFTNSASITYTDKITTDGTPTDETYTSKPTEESQAKIRMGSVLICKVDDKGNPLKGAEFKIATSFENAKAGIYLKDKNNKDIVAISDEEGHVKFDGLKYGGDNESTSSTSTSYWVVETRAPTYVENELTKHYKLQEKPIEVLVNENSHIFSKGQTVEVVNKKIFQLPHTGQTFLFVLIQIILGIIIILISYKLIKKENIKE